MADQPTRELIHAWRNALQQDLVQRITGIQNDVHTLATHFGPQESRNQDHLDRAGTGLRNALDGINKFNPELDAPTPIQRSTVETPETPKTPKS